jgi:hypothetical protein
MIKYQKDETMIYMYSNNKFVGAYGFTFFMIPPIKLSYLARTQCGQRLCLTTVITFVSGLLL